MSAWAAALAAQEPEPRPELVAGAATGPIVLDGRLDEPCWLVAPFTDAFRTTEPVEGGQPSSRTEIRALADAKTIYVGIRCFDPQPAAIVGYSVARDADLDSEDHVKFVFGTFRDGRTGYVFAVNPRGARYDALIAARGEDENKDWDGGWEAATAIDAQGWTAEVRLPAAMFAFAAGATSWDFNVERRVQRFLERSRWANPRLDQRVTHMLRAGLLAKLPVFDLGLGITARPALVGRYGRKTRSEPTDTDLDPSLDVIWRITPELSGVVTVNTDFAETEADQRRINLTRFPLLFPEKRTFFREGADAFDFGIGLEEEFLPFYSRRIGLVNGSPVQLLYGAKVVGRAGGTNIAALATHMDSEPGVAPETDLGAVRIRQDVLAESNVGIIVTAGDPLGRSNARLFGADATYQTSELFGGSNFLFGIWGAEMTRDDIAGNSSAYGFKADYPNDEWDLNASYKHFDADFDPSLGFLTRNGVDHIHFGADHAVRPNDGWLRKQTFESGTDIYLDLDGRWTSYRVFLSPVNAVLESGDGFEFNVIPQGERFTGSFEIGDGVVIPGGTYDWWRYRAVFTAAEKRPLAGEFAYGFGDFYDGTLDQWVLSARAVLSPILTLRATADIVRGRLPQGDFAQDVYGLKVSFTFSPDLTLDSFLQYDTDSRSAGTNTRLRWDITPTSQLFLIANVNALREDGSFVTDGYETALKIVQEFRF